MTMLITTAEVVKRRFHMKTLEYTQSPCKLDYTALCCWERANKAFRHLQTVASSKIGKGLDGLIEYHIRL
jgi:hypothetical protein